MQAIRQRGG